MSSGTLSRSTDSLSLYRKPLPDHSVLVRMFESDPALRAWCQPENYRPLLTGIVRENMECLKFSTVDEDLDKQDPDVLLNATLEPRRLLDTLWVFMTSIPSGGAYFNNVTEYHMVEAVRFLLSPDSLKECPKYLSILPGQEPFFFAPIAKVRLDLGI